ncbi:hypothetical protein Tco_0379100 [Tanacetum coccineum]
MFIWWVRYTIRRKKKGDCRGKASGEDRYWKDSICSDDDLILPFAITPVVPTKEPFNSSMGDRAILTYSGTESVERSDFYHGGSLPMNLATSYLHREYVISALGLKLELGQYSMDVMEDLFQT